MGRGGGGKQGFLGPQDITVRGSWGGENYLVTPASLSPTAPRGGGGWGKGLRRWHQEPWARAVPCANGPHLCQGDLFSEHCAHVPLRRRCRLLTAHGLLRTGEPVRVKLAD